MGPGHVSDGGTPPIDRGNTLLTPTPSVLSMSRVRMPDGTELAVATIRTTSATVTVYLSKAEAEAWGENFQFTAAKMSSLIAAPPNGHRPLGEGR